MIKLKTMFVLMPGWEEKWGSCAPVGLVMKFALFQNSHFQRSTLEVCPNVSLRREVRLLLTTRNGSEVCILLWPISWSFMFVLMCDWEEKWGSCSPPGLVMKFALFCDHQRDAKCDTFWELRSFLSPQGNGLGGLRLPKSLYISWVLSNFYGTKIEIWAGFGPVGNTEKNN